MPQQNSTNGNTAVKHEDSHTRVTAARSLYRNMMLPKNYKLAVVPAETGPLHAKEEECCSRATD